MRIVLTAIAAVLSGCLGVGSLCLLLAVSPEASAVARALCSDPALAATGTHGTYCYCDTCGGIADDLGGIAGPHNFKNSSSHGPCPGIGGSCHPTGFAYRESPDGATGIVALDMLSARDLSPLPDLAPLPDLVTLPDLAPPPDLAPSCRARLPAIEACRALPDKVRAACVNSAVGTDAAAGWLALCVAEKCPGGTLLSAACVTPKCAPECCIALQGCAP